MMWKQVIVAAGLLTSLVLGATVVREPIAGAAQAAAQERPFQVTVEKSFSKNDHESPWTCTPVLLRPGKPFVLKAVAVSSFPAIEPFVLRVHERVPSGLKVYPAYGFQLDSHGRADKLIELHVRPNRRTDAAIGDITRLEVCFGGGPNERQVRAILSGYYE